MHPPSYCGPLLRHQTHLLVLLTPDHPLVTYPPPPGAPGYVRQPSFHKPLDAGVDDDGGASDVHTCEHHPDPTTSGDKEPSIGRKIIDLFRPGAISKDEAVKEHIIDPKTGETTKCPPADPTTTHAEAILFPALTPEMADKGFPAFVGGQATRHVAVPLGAITEMNLIDDRSQIGVRVLVSELVKKKRIYRGRYKHVEKKSGKSSGRWQH